MSLNIENQIVSKIYDKGRGWVFSQKDFATFSKAETINRYLARLYEKGTIRRLCRGLYDYPRFSKLLNQALPPDIDQAAHALARQFGWNIEITGNSALNLLGISTQVPTQYVYLSDGPSRTYVIIKQKLRFKSGKKSHMGLKYAESKILVQAIHSLGSNGLTEKEKKAMAKYLLSTCINSSQLKSIEKDTQYVTSWVFQEIKDVLILADKKLKDREDTYAEKNR